MLRSLAIFVGIIFIISGVMGFIPEFTHEGKLFGIFAINSIKNFVHIAVGLLGVFTGWKSRVASRAYFIAVGVMFLIITVLGFFHVATDVLKYILIDNVDLWLNAALAAIFLYIGYLFIRK